MLTNIVWADKSLNFYNWFCTKTSSGCVNCYMFAMRKQFGREPKSLEWRDTALIEYGRLKSGEVVFVNSMSDTYHEDAPFEWIERIHNLVANRPDVYFLLLTKRPHIALSYAHRLLWPENLWLAVSVEDREYLERIDILGKIPAKHRFLSIEPLLGSLMPEISRVDLGHINWMIVGGESGPKRRTFDKQWARELRTLCDERGIHFTLKQGSHNRPGNDYNLDGNEYLTTPFICEQVKQTEMFGSNE